MIKKLQVVLIFRARCISSLSHDSITDFPWGVVDASECQVKTWNFRRITSIFFFFFRKRTDFRNWQEKAREYYFRSICSPRIRPFIQVQFESSSRTRTVGKNNYLLQNFSLSNQFIINFGLNLSYIYIGILNSNNN